MPTLGSPVDPKGGLKRLRCFSRWLWVCLWLTIVSPTHAQVWINELLFNPPTGDTTNEYVELRGPPNLLLPAGTYLVSVEGDTAENPGMVQNLFDLSGRRLGQNGFLVLLQKFHRYKPNPLAAVVTNTDSDGGWGTGSSSSVRHTGENDQVEIENASCTFFLIEAASAPVVGTTDVDGNNDGVLDGAALAWTILDSVGVLDSDNAGDFAYGKINFRRDALPGAGAGVPAGATLVSIPFTPGYVARNGNTDDWVGTNWVASDNLLARPPNWMLGGNSALSTNTTPAKRAKAPLNHLGGPNFKAPVLPSVLVRQSGANTQVREGSLSDSYLLQLSLRPTGAVTVQIEVELPVQVSLDGRTYASEATVPLTSSSARKIFVRAVDDGATGPAQSTVVIAHSIVTSLDSRFPTDLAVLSLPVTILDTNVIVLSEAKVNPPGADAPFEFVEITGPPDRILTNLYLVAVQGNDSVEPGRADVVVNLAGKRPGTNGLLVVAAPGHPYTFASATTVVLAPQFANVGGALDNGSVSLLLIGSSTPITEGSDLDSRDNGSLDGLPAGAFVVDAIGWSDGGSSDEIYGGVDLSQHGFTPDAASRFKGNLTPRSAAAWFVGDLAGTSGGSLDYSSGNTSSNLPPGSVLTPGVIYQIGPELTPAKLPALSGVLGDPNNETITFTVSDKDTPLNSLTVTATSTNQAVVPNANISLAQIAPGRWQLALEPVGVGYSEIMVRVTDGFHVRNGFVEYGASAAGRPTTQWHTSVSDASTAMPIDDDWMFVGDDERQVIRIYSRKHSGGPVAEKDINSALHVVDFYDDDSPKEVDIEGSTRVGNRIYWLGSHSHAFNAQERTNRARLFATDISGTGTNTQLKVVGHYDYLKLDLIEWDANNGHGKGAHYYGLTASAAIGKDPKEPDGSGFNFEGLAMAPGLHNTTNAYACFRAPLAPAAGDAARSKALIIPVLNFGKLATTRLRAGSARFGAPIELNLGGRAIRSIEGSGTNYLIIAGPPGAGANLPPPGNFKLFTWSGQPTDVPVEHDGDLAGLNAEGIVEVFPGEWNASTEFQIISDNGTNRFYGDDIQAKFLEDEGKPRQFKKFRVDSVALGNPVFPAPTIRAVAASDDAMTVSWFSMEGTAYRVQAKPGLVAEWTDVTSDVTATDAVAHATIPWRQNTQGFFRVVAAPAAK